jgi:hypothetical protein
VVEFGVLSSQVKENKVFFLEKIKLLGRKKDGGRDRKEKLPESVNQMDRYEWLQQVIDAIRERAECARNGIINEVRYQNDIAQQEQTDRYERLQERKCRASSNREATRQRLREYLCVYR